MKGRSRGKMGKGLVQMQLQQRNVVFVPEAVERRWSTVNWRRIKRWLRQVREKEQDEEKEWLQEQGQEHEQKQEGRGESGGDTDMMDGIENTRTSIPAASGESR